MGIPRVVFLSKMDSFVSLSLHVPPLSYMEQSLYHSVVVA
jgi:hypothetical protein